MLACNDQAIIPSSLSPCTTDLMALSNIKPSLKPKQ